MQAHGSCMLRFPIVAPMDTHGDASMPSSSSSKPRHTLCRPLNGASGDEPSTAGSDSRSQSGARHHVAAGVALQGGFYSLPKLSEPRPWPYYLHRSRSVHLRTYDYLTLLTPRLILPYKTTSLNSFFDILHSFLHIRRQPTFTLKSNIHHV